MKKIEILEDRSFCKIFVSTVDKQGEHKDSYRRSFYKTRMEKHKFNPLGVLFFFEFETKLKDIDWPSMLSKLFL